jgi:hypothetical protein
MFLKSPCPLWKYDRTKNNNSCCLLYNLLYMDVIFIYLHSIYYCGTLTPLKLIMLSIKILSFPKIKISKRIVKENTQSFIIFKNILLFTLNLQTHYLFYKKYVLKLTLYYKEILWIIYSMMCAFYIPRICYKGCNGKFS